MVDPRSSALNMLPSAARRPVNRVKAASPEGRFGAALTPTRVVSPGKLTMIGLLSAAIWMPILDVAGAI